MTKESLMIVKFFCCLFSVCLNIVGLCLLAMWCCEWFNNETSRRKASVAMVAKQQPLVSLINEPYVDISNIIGVDESCLVSCFPDNGNFKVSLYASSNEVIFVTRGFSCLFRNPTRGTCTNVVAVQHGESFGYGNVSWRSGKITNVSSFGQTWTRVYYPGETQTGFFNKQER